MSIKVWNVELYESSRMEVATLICATKEAAIKHTKQNLEDFANPSLSQEELDNDIIFDDISEYFSNIIWRKGKEDEELIGTLSEYEVLE